MPLNESLQNVVKKQPSTIRNTTIPEISIKELSNLRTQSSALKLLEKACKETGFFAITDHGITPQLRNQLQIMTQLFFSKSQSFKRCSQIGFKGRHSGYVPFSENGLYQDESHQRLYEAFDLSLELPESDPDHQSGNIFYGPNRWPDINGFKNIVYAYYQKMNQLSLLLTDSFEKILHMPKGYMRSKMQKPTSQLRLIHYIENKLSKNCDNLNTNMGAHTDYELFTILSSTAAGLQTQNRAGNWIDVPVYQHALTINIGDMLEVWSNGIFKSNLHRVVNYGHERFSFPFFASLDYHTEVTPWNSCTKNHINWQKTYQTVEAGRHLLQQVTRDFSYLRHQLKANTNPFLKGLMLNANPYESTVLQEIGNAS